MEPDQQLESFSDVAESLRGLYSTTDDVVNGFYVPLLRRAKSYDRVAGYFTSWGLAIAARGLASFIPTGGTVRLIVGAQLAKEDVGAVQSGEELADIVAARLASENFWDDLDEIRAHRLHVLAWLAKEGRLRIKVGVPRRDDGTLISANETRDYFHDKFGIFTDHAGQRVGFIGSNNDSFSGWIANSESFSVFPEWNPPVWAWNGQLLVEQFERLWKEPKTGPWAIVSLSQAVQGSLLRIKEFTSPPSTRDPEEATDTALPEPEVVPLSQDELVALRSIINAPLRAPFTAVMSAGVEPLPHQRAVIDRAVRTFPRGYLFGDEVGLGKTIEVGLTIREIVLTGQSSRILLLVPAAVLTQWQEELAEKVSLWVPRWADGRWVWPDRSESPAAPGDPWAANNPISLVSSHLARTSKERDRLRAAAPWDVVVVDEAHHARRRGGKANGTPNALLSLLQGLHDEGGWQALYLASATPMQMYPHEAWDLLALFDPPGWWSESAEKFEKYFRELSKDWPDRQWDFLARMVNDHFLDEAAEPNQDMDAQIMGTFAGPDRVTLLKGIGRSSQVAIAERLVKHQGGTVKANRQWVRPVGANPKMASTVTAWLYSNNPMRDRVFRNTRNTLRAYRDVGLWPAKNTIPNRVVDDQPIQMTLDERDLYCRVQTYIKTKYDQAEQIANGQVKNALGFILTVYRRRLTSSFRAIEQSLRRRIDALEGRLDASALLSPDDMALEEDRLDIAAAVHAWALDDEIVDLRQLADDLKVIADADESKMLALHRMVEQALQGGHQTVLVFTQYADTMIYVRDRLDAIYKGRVIGYASDGGTIHNTDTGEWDSLSKRQTKNLFRAGERVKVLVGTDSLSEGLNLQTCGRLINYDLPWNFTRVEQRIGRVDRIGGHELVEVSNLLYDGTVETTVYRRLVNTFGGFNAVVGLAQPILGQVASVIRTASIADMCDENVLTKGSLLTQGSGSADLNDEVASIIAAASDARARTLARLDEHGSPIEETVWTPAMTLDQVQEALFSIPSIASRFEQTDTQHLYKLNLAGKSYLVTFDRETLDQLSPDVRLLIWGDPLFELLVATFGSAGASSEVPV